MQSLASRCAACACLLLFACRSSSSDFAESSESASTGSRPAWSLVCSFDSANAGTVPTGFTAWSGEWSIVEDPTSPSPTHALAQTGKSAENVVNMIVMDDVKQADVDLDVKLKTVGGEADQGGGLAWRLHDTRNGYVARLSPVEHNLRIYKLIDGEKKQLQSASVHVTNGWHELRITMHGDTIRGYLDGSGCITARDTTFSAPGKVGLWTRADAQTHFDDLKIGETH